MPDNVESVDMIVTHCRAVNVRAASMYVERGVEPIDAAMGSALATIDILRAAGLPAIDAVEWIRSFADMIERDILAEG
ncbi:hypothetical protein [Sphingomonas sp. 28-63-12]|uniref:hypothetical protein n=1 Tax=Sphingomonas sp. 28-63-12 TaxID=1970434 RepID=UPI000BDC81C4|nr:MAG: hypothetical protein B7Y47_02940 [Sphingomonas sp. 28-63-12]